ncbi:MAG: InlB B-repeat-containing protein [Prevotella sp.]|nr:InlB B-repeat-containing protein [Prevotella sp.]
MNRTRELLWTLLLLCWGSISAFAQTGGFDPVNPPEPMLQYKVTVGSTPSGVAYTSGGGKYNAGTTITIGTSSRNSSYVFDHWLKDGERIEQAATFSYVVEAKNVTFTAVYRFNPNNPPEPTVSNKYRLYLVPSPEGVSSFNITSGDKKEAGSRIWLKANGSQGFVFSGWYDGDELVSNQAGFYYTMPARDVTLTAKYTYNPNNPDEPEGNQENVDNYMLGDVNNDGVVDVNDIVTTANYILHQVNPEANAAPPVFIFKAADVIEDSDIDVNDIVGIANIIIENAQGN